MGFYATDQLDAVLEPHQENPYPPSKNRVWNFFTTSDSCAGFFESQPVEPHQEKLPTPTTTVSGVRYYGHRFYQPETGRWVSRDPIGERGFEITSWRQKTPRDIKKELQAELYSKLQRVAPKLVARLNLGPLMPETQLYVFVQNNPLNVIDPQGTSCAFLGTLASLDSAVCIASADALFAAWEGCIAAPEACAIDIAVIALSCGTASTGWTHYIDCLRGEKCPNEHDIAAAESSLAGILHILNELRELL